jgi:hypothetical protein
MLAIGVDAFPMVGVMAVCAGFILAMQGASELSRLGAIDFVVDLVTIGFTRELGPLLTAIAVSGRSGSAFSAEPWRSRRKLADDRAGQGVVARPAIRHCPRQTESGAGRIAFSRRQCAGWAAGLKTGCTIL